MDSTVSIVLIVSGTVFYIVIEQVRRLPPPPPLFKSVVVIILVLQHLYFMHAVYPEQYYKKLSVKSCWCEKR